MKAIKNISDELWLGLMFLLVAVWMYFLNRGYLIISGMFAFAGIILLIVDSIKKTTLQTKKIEIKKAENPKISKK